MSLREIARFADVYEAELAGAFLASHGIDVTVTERFQTTVDPLMQRALGIRLMAPASTIEAARALLARARAGEFATEDGDSYRLRVDEIRRVRATVSSAAADGPSASASVGDTGRRRFMLPALIDLVVETAPDESAPEPAADKPSSPGAGSR